MRLLSMNIRSLLRSRTLLTIGVVATLVSVLAFFVIVGIGSKRERRDIRANQEWCETVGRERRALLAQIKEGDSLAKLMQMFPNAYQDLTEGSGDVMVPVYTDYDESPICTNIFYESHHFAVTAGRIMEKSGIGSGSRHMDHFRDGGAWYYFRRAWRSTKGRVSY